MTKGIFKYLTLDGGMYDPSVMLQMRLEFRHSDPEEVASFITSARAMPYKHYLRTVYWGAVRGWLATTRKQVCAFCGSPWPTPVHHLNYEHRGCEHNHLDDLQLLCYRCHMDRHGLLVDPEAIKSMKRSRVSARESGYGILRPVAEFGVDLEYLQKNVDVVLPSRANQSGD